ncbi:hypothetical protein jhhlp_007617 [Lomentospora prolificans]|uniref:Ras-GAP domain-containing protein n=1 Tax=Lomentospora prolificans TaxID=41688 RepID=A0A2N3N040_9PEZI|nr:hypothetical protein jhhlp_007617 [Lomentospora prolificans]
MLPMGIDGRLTRNPAQGSQDSVVLDWSLPPVPHSDTQSPQSPQSRPMEKPRTSATSLRSTFNRSTAGAAQSTIRAVTPEPVEYATSDAPLAATATITTALGTHLPQHHPSSTASDAPFPGSVSSPGATGSGVIIHRPRPGLSTHSPQASPRSIPGGPARRQGMVFNDAFDGSEETNTTAASAVALSSSPSPPRLPPRQRTYTIEAGSVRQPSAASLSAPDSRRRIGSFSSAGSQHVDDLRNPPPPLESLGFPSIMPNRHQSDVDQSPKVQLKDKKLSARRLIKRQSSRPTSPLISPPPSVDSLPLPIPTEDANKILLLMKNLCGRMRGDVEYQLEVSAPWQSGMAYIEEEKGSLMLDSGHDGPFHVPLISDLRGCRVVPLDSQEKGKYDCLEIIATPAVDLIIKPSAHEEMDLWLAALLCWQQLRPVGGLPTNSKPTSPANPSRPELRRRTSSNGPGKGTSIIKVGKVMLWDKGLATSPRAIVKRPSTRDLRSPATSWRRVSCILQDNGELKLLTETDSSILSVIELSQLSRCAIQKLDRTVLDEEYCVAIFPIYSPSSTQLSIFRPVYVALDTRVHFEVWFVLLRAFAVPDIYRLDPASRDGVSEVLDLKSDDLDGVFRIEKSLSLRVTEAKIRPKPSLSDLGPLQRIDSQENLVGNYLAEVILDGEVRARTTTKTQTKNPFWREDCEFYDLPPSFPYLSVILKRVEGNMESVTHQLQASLGLPRTGNLTEVVCGAVDLPVEELERGKDHEEWLQILDDRQQNIGTMFVKIHHEELVVLLSKEYQPLSELLHRFPSGLTSQIAEVMPHSLRRLSELFLNIFQVSGMASEWLMALVEDEIDGIGNQAPIKTYRFSKRLRSSESLDSASDREQIVRDMSRSLTGEANLLFRGNSLLTQSLEFHMRRLGKEYLEDVLLDKIFEINEINPSCEVDPSRLQDGDNLQHNWTQLIQLTTEVWDCIAASTNRLPPELRHILKYIRAVAEDRYGDFLRTVSYTSVSGFLFLRFICPAILSPKLFGLLRDHPRPRAQRTLTLIAKALQALSNLTTFGQKESWMEPMNKFLGSHRQAVKEFIDHICSIPAERSTNPVPASYSTPITIQGRLSSISREGFPSLPYLIDQSRNFAGLVRLWVDANPLAHHSARAARSHTNLSPTSVDAQSVPDGDLLIFNDICHDLQKRSDECFARVESIRGKDAGAQSISASVTALAAATATSAMITTDELVESLEHTTLMENAVKASFATQGSSSSGGNIEAASAVFSSSVSSSHWEHSEAAGIGSWGLGGNVSNLRPPGSSGSDVIDPRERRGRSTRQASAVSEAGTGTLRSSRNGRVTRGILSGIMRMGRSDSPDSAPGGSSGSKLSKERP